MKLTRITCYLSFLTILIAHVLVGAFISTATPFYRQTFKQLLGDKELPVLTTVILNYPGACSPILVGLVLGICLTIPLYFIESRLNLREHLPFWMTFAWLGALVHLATFSVAAILPFVSFNTTLMKLESVPGKTETAVDFVDQLYREPGSAIQYPAKEALPYFETELQLLIEEAIKVRSDFEKKNPGDKPPFADYSLLTLSMDGYVSYEVINGKTERPGESLIVVKLLQNPNDQIAPAFTYFYLKRSGGRWLIQRVTYHWTDPVSKKPEELSLADRLRADLKNPQ